MAFASLAMLPVMLIAWLGGRGPGLAMAFVASTMWTATDIYGGRQFSMVWIPWLNAIVRFLTYGLMVLLVSQVKFQFSQERELATHDALTGLLNRRGILAQGLVEAERANRYRSHFAVIFLDLDNFKTLNDRMGHHIGDEALQAISGALRGTTRTSDLLARMGGDEFALVLPEIDFDAAKHAAHKIFKAVNRALEAYPPTSASVGVAWFQEADRSFLELLQVADDLMYTVKADGKNDILIRRFP